jgi:hypothetical protein
LHEVDEGVGNRDDEHDQSRDADGKPRLPTSTVPFIRHLRSSVEWFDRTQPKP